MEVTIENIDKLQHVIKEPVIRGLVEEACRAMAREAHFTRSLTRTSVIHSHYDDVLYEMIDYIDIIEQARLILAETFIYYANIYRLSIAPEREE